MNDSPCQVCFFDNSSQADSSTPASAMRGFACQRPEHMLRAGHVIVENAPSCTRRY
jgi:hypothetical protein